MLIEKIIRKFSKKENSSISKQVITSMWYFVNILMSVCLYLSIYFLKTTIAAPFLSKVIYSSKASSNFDPKNNLGRKSLVKLCVGVCVCVLFII